MARWHRYLPTAIAVLLLMDSRPAGSRRRGRCRGQEAAGHRHGRARRDGFSPERFARIDAAMQGYIERNEVARVVALVARKGKVVHFEAYGAKDADSKAPMTRDAIFRIASMTKPITSVALMMLYEEGHFQLRDPISQWLPEFADMQVAVPPDADEYVAQPFKLVPAARPITVQHILTHTAGFTVS